MLRAGGWDDLNADDAVAASDAPRESPRAEHDESLARIVALDYREHLAEQLSGTVFSELNALATRLAAHASSAPDPKHKAGLLAEADTVAGLLARLRTILFTLDPPSPELPVRRASGGRRQDSSWW